MSIFLDTGFFIALYNNRDKFHETAIKLFEKMKKHEFGKIYTSYFVLDETLTYLQAKMPSSRFVYDLAEIWIIKKIGFAAILEMNPEVYNKTTKLFMKQQNERKPLSFTDCSNVILCQDNYISQIASYDGEFNRHLNTRP